MHLSLVSILEEILMIEASKMIPVPSVRQSKNYTCGPSALKSVLSFFGHEVTEKELADDMNTNEKDGTANDNIVRVAKERGLKADLHKNMSFNKLKSVVNKKQPVIIAYQAWPEKETEGWEEGWNNGHYSVVVAVDNKDVYLEDPSVKDSKTRIPHEEFVKRWHDQDADGEKYEQLGIVLSER
jgi:uncharacterized protein